MTTERQPRHDPGMIRTRPGDAPDPITLALADALREIARRRAATRGNLRLVGGTEELTRN